MRFIYSKFFAWFVVALCIAAVSILMQTKGWFSPIQQFVLYLPRPVVTLSEKIIYPVKGFVKNVYTIRDIVRENNDLRRAVVLLEERMVEFNRTVEENALLKRELAFVEKSPLVLEPCTVLAQDPEGVTNTIVLNCGSSQGIRSGQAVVSDGVLVAKVFIVNNTTSTATLMTNSDFSVDARVSGTDVSGIVKGSFGSGITMDLISQTATVNPGDLVVTAGINEYIPKDVLIGEVGDIVSVPNDLFKKVTVRSPANYKNFDYVFVIK
jgi:rod shape-determining protein MreC